MDGRDLSYGQGGAQQLALRSNPVRLWGALLVLLVLTGLAIAGPWGVLAWYENSAALDNRAEQIALLEEEIAALENRVGLLNPDEVDADLAGELARRNLGVMHADEVVITLPDE